MSGVSLACHAAGGCPRLARLGARPETAVRGGGGAVAASIRRRRAGCLDRPPPAPPHRRCDGAPASPLRYSARVRTARLSPARGDPAGDGLSSLHLPRRDEGARRVGPPLRCLEPAPAGGARWPRPSTAAARGEPAVRNGAARERGRRRSACEAPNGLVAPGPVSSGAESKRGRSPRSRAQQSRVAHLAEVPHAEQHGPAGEREEPIGGGDGGALLAECQAPRYIEKQAARGGGAHPERPSDRETPRTRDPYPAGGDHDSSKIQGAVDVE